MAAAAKRAASRLGIHRIADWPTSWDQTKGVTIETIYVLIEELDTT